jgi:hypothetical protein
MSRVCSRQALGETEVLVTGDYDEGNPPEQDYPGDPERIDIISAQINGVQIGFGCFAEEQLLKWETAMLESMADDAISRAETRANALMWCVA